MRCNVLFIVVTLLSQTESAVADCRSEALGAMRAGMKAGPYRMEGETRSATLTTKTRVLYDLPDRLHGYVTKDKTQQMVKVGERYWLHDGNEWHAVPPDVGRQMTQSLSQMNSMLDGLTGQVKCLPNTTVNGIASKSYELEMSAPQDQRIKLAGTLYVEQATGLPIRLESGGTHATGPIFVWQNYIYDKSIKIEPPGGMR